MPFLCNQLAVPNLFASSLPFRNRDSSSVMRQKVAAECPAKERPKLRAHCFKYVAGWWLSHPSEKYEFVSWDHYSQHMEKYNMFQTTNQVEEIYPYVSKEKTYNHLTLGTILRNSWAKGDWLKRHLCGTGSE